MISEKRGIELSFSWLFAIIVGAVIIFIAIYVTTNVIRTSRYELDTMTAKKLSIIFNPLETGGTISAKSSVISFSSDTRIYNDCSNIGTFGSQSFSLSTRSGIGSEWQEPGGEITLKNKYVFSDEVQGKKIEVFSMPFDTGFQTASIIFLYTKKYCFKTPPNEVEDDISELNLVNVKIENCTSEMTNVCFGSSGRDCEIAVYGQCTGSACESTYDTGYILKNGEKAYYYGNLIYGAIFSNQELYECNVKRLMKRTAQIAYLYAEESNFLDGKGCHTGLNADLMSLGRAADNLDSSQELVMPNGIFEKSNELELKGGSGACCLWNCAFN